MVSLTGAQQATPLVAQIQQLEASIAAVSGALKAAPTIWKMSADVYLTLAPNSNSISQSLALQYAMNADDSQTILNAVLTGLQNELAALNQQIAAIS